MPIKTLHLTSYWHERSGGIATFYRHLLAAANRHQCSMVLVVPGAHDEVEQVGEYCRIYTLSAPASPFNSDYRTIYPRKFLLPGSRVQQILAYERPDLVEICGKYSLVHLGHLLRLGLAQGLDFRPAVVGLTCERMDENFAAYVTRASWGRAFSRFYMRHRYFSAFDQHIAISDNTAAELKAVAEGHLVPRGVWIRPVGVDIEQFSAGRRSSQFRGQLLRRCGNPQNAILLLYAGRLSPEKNLQLLIATMSELARTGKGFRLLVAGEGIAKHALERAAEAQAPGKVVFLGHIESREELARLYASCDVFVHPNPTEPFGIAPLEAMASGLPLVAPNRGGVLSYATDANAYLADPAPAAFAEAIAGACREDEGRLRKTQAARKTAESLAWPEVTGSFLRLYEELHRMVIGQESIERYRPEFVSSSAGVMQGKCLRLASQLARMSFLAYVRAHQLAASIVGNRNQHRTELKGLQIQ